jgi:hypothetical protein
MAPELSILWELLLRFLFVGTAVDRIGRHDARVCRGKNRISLLGFSGETYHFKPM